ncbi:hypothetical protein [Pseudomonas sp. K2I15]|uniref:hypothetical protein n=1 Tax=unclassified Pseudomonas TaxID=196821 RepID=UPI001131568A|nr:hypothetical protein [Pseudomonas sp. K2I15]
MSIPSGSPYGGIAGLMSGFGSGIGSGFGSGSGSGSSSLESEFERSKAIQTEGLRMSNDSKKLNNVTTAAKELR